MNPSYTFTENTLKIIVYEFSWAQTWTFRNFFIPQRVICPQYFWNKIMFVINSFSHYSAKLDRMEMKCMSVIWWQHSVNSSSWNSELVINQSSICWWIIIKIVQYWCLGQHDLDLWKLLKLRTKTLAEGYLRFGNCLWYSRAAPSVYSKLTYLKNLF